MGARPKPLGLKKFTRDVYFMLFSVAVCLSISVCSVDCDIVSRND